MVDIRKSGQTDEEQELEISEEEGVIGYVYDKFEDAENGRFSDEQRWLDAYKNYRGSENEEYRSSERSKVFVKVTKVKVLAAYGQIIDILFASIVPSRVCLPVVLMNTILLFKKSVSK